MKNNPATVLVVEDDAMNRNGLVRLLQYIGVGVDAASNVTEALEKLKGLPSLVLLDMHLPDGSGAEVLRHIRAKKIAAHVCVLTGSVEPAALDRLEPLAPDAIFMKPVDPDKLLHWVQQVTSPQKLAAR